MNNKKTKIENGSDIIVKTKEEFLEAIKNLKDGDSIIWDEQWQDGSVKLNEFEIADMMRKRGILQYREGYFDGYRKGSEDKENRIDKLKLPKVKVYKYKGKPWRKNYENRRKRILRR